MRHVLRLRQVVVGFMAFAAIATSATTSNAATKPSAKANLCSKFVALRPVGTAARGGTFIWKSNWNKRAGREATYWEGNHSQKGGAFLVFYTSALAPNKFSIQVRDANCNVLGTMGRFPRCTNLGCGQHERWYFRTSGGSGYSIAALSAKARKAAGSDTIFVELRGGKWAKISSVYNGREQM